MRRLPVLLVSILTLCGAARAQTIPYLDEAIETAIRKGEVPGIVCIVGYKDTILHRKAYGSRALEPQREDMTVDTIFDAASLTKVVATTSSILKLVEEGKVRLNDRVTVYLPGFQNGKSDITLRHLLTHYSGLRPDLDLDPPWSGQALGISKALVDKPAGEPGQRFVYSDINFILLGEIVRQVSGLPLNEYAKANVFSPLGMDTTSYLPAATLRARIAPTEKLKGETLPLRGMVHDETTRFMGGVAGHAGLFTTADDLAKFARMVLSQGGGLFSPLTIREATRVQSPAGVSALRGLGWDIDSPFAGNRGDLYPIGSFGHTGFTGTSLWIDPSTESYVIVLGNHVHPFRRTPITPLRGRVASIAAAHVSKLHAGIKAMQSMPKGHTLTGLDKMVADKFVALSGKRVGLITNQTGISREGKRNIDLMLEAGVNLRALFSPEHGILGKQDDTKVKDSVDAASKLPIYSLYFDENRKPNTATLKGIDVLVFDIQDVGARFYTYGCTMRNAMEVAAELKLEFVVLDRPNPITGSVVEGPMIDKAEMSFIGCLPLPVRHGFTIGELARFANDQLPKPAKLTVVPMENWQRDYWWDETGLMWVNPSPNMRTVNAALLYPGIAQMEFSRNYSVGRGTDAPFEVLGAPWIRGGQLAIALNKVKDSGIQAYPVRFKPATGPLAGVDCEGVRLIVTDRDKVRASAYGTLLMSTLARLYPGEPNFEANRKLIGNADTIRRLRGGEAAESIIRNWETELGRFLKVRERYLIYQ